MTLAFIILTFMQLFRLYVFCPTPEDKYTNGKTVVVNFPKSKILLSFFNTFGGSQNWVILPAGGAFTEIPLLPNLSWFKSTILDMFSFCGWDGFIQEMEKLFE